MEVDTRETLPQRLINAATKLQTSESVRMSGIQDSAPTHLATVQMPLAQAQGPTSKESILWISYMAWTL